MGEKSKVSLRTMVSGKLRLVTRKEHAKMEDKIQKGRDCLSMNQELS